MSKNTIIIIIVSFLTVVSISAISAEENDFTVGIWIGSFSPQNEQIQGQHTILYDTSGNPYSASVSGFGNGVDLMIYGTYYYNSYGIRLETGPRLLQKRKLDIDLLIHSETYENRLNIIPITMTLLYRLQKPETNISPYIGFGSGIYISSWEQKHSTDSTGTFERTWDKGSSNPIGIHVLAGLDYPLFRGIFLSGEIKYSYINSDWDIDRTINNLTPSKIEMKDLNIGGTSILMGLNYRF